MGKLGTVMSVLAAGAAVILPIEQAAACTYAFSEEVLKRDYVFEGRLRRECTRLGVRNARFLRDIARGRYDGDHVSTMAKAFRSGEYGCENDPGYALRMWNAFLPDPLTVDVDVGHLWEVKELAADRRGQLRGERYREIVGLIWLLTPGGPGLAEQGWSAAEIDRFLLRPDYWTLAIEHFGVKPERDEAVFRLLTDRAHPLFDRARAAELARAGTHLPYKERAATLLLDPRFGEPDVAAASEIAAGSDSRELQARIAATLLQDRFGQPGLDAARALLAWYSPYVHYGDEADGSAALLWRSIASRLSGSDDAQTRASGEAIERTGDPRAWLATTTLPPVPELVVLETWPGALPPLNLGPPARWGDLYPARAIRDEMAGLAGISALFGSDGRFSRLWVSRSSGSVLLDEAAMAGLERYARPNLAELRLPGFTGRSVLVPVAQVEWHLSPKGEGPEGAVVGDNRIVVGANWIKRPDSRSVC
jgi:hypothetical protein